jgi:alkylated DNA nucleotide flippase Atl1
MLLLLNLEERGTCTVDEVSEALSNIESFLVRRMICGVPTNNLNRIFNALPDLVGSQDAVATRIREALSRERNFWPDNSTLQAAMRSRPFYWQGRATQRRLVLRRLEESYPTAERVDLDQAALTIEHVLPQSPTIEWLDILHEEVAQGETAEDLHRQLVHTIGNLTLTGYNTQLSNSPFQRKQDLLRQSNLELNRRIAATTRWGKAEIQMRAEELASRAIGIWPEPANPVRSVEGRDWSSLEKVLAEVPAGAWTTCGDLAVVIGSHAVPVGVRLSTVQVPNAHRVLTAEGGISPQFHWLDPEDHRDPTDVLRAEGVVLDASGIADPNQRLDAGELAALVGLEVSEESMAMPSMLTELEAGHTRFVGQVGERQGPEIVGAVERLLQDWSSLGRALDFGKASETSCFLLVKPRVRAPWPFTLYPYGSVEVVFQYLRTRPPFDDLSLRDEFRTRLNSVDGIDIPPAKLELRPSFPMKILTGENGYRGVMEALNWFVNVVQKSEQSPNDAETSFREVA